MILLIADIHFKLGQSNVPEEWAKHRYNMFFEQVQAAITKHSVTSVVIPGDTFDRKPSLAELEIFIEFIKIFTVPTYITTGNHEATKKNHTFLTNLKKMVEYINPLVKVILAPTTIENYHIVPYEYIKDKKTWDSLEPLPVFTHVRGEIPPHVKPEIDLDWLDKFPVVFAGDLHSFSNSQRNIVYPGEPMTGSFHRSPKETGYIIINPEDLTQWTWHAFELPQLIRKAVSTEAEMVATTFDHTIYELHGSLESLSTVSNSELLDKKVIKKSSDVALILNNMTISEELVEYLLYIADLDEDRVKELAGVFNGYNKTK